MSQTATDPSSLGFERLGLDEHGATLPPEVVELILYFTLCAMPITDAAPIKTAEKRQRFLRGIASLSRSWAQASQPLLRRVICLVIRSNARLAVIKSRADICETADTLVVSLPNNGLHLLGILSHITHIYLRGTMAKGSLGWDSKPLRFPKLRHLGLRDYPASFGAALSHLAPASFSASSGGPAPHVDMIRLRRLELLFSPMVDFETRLRLLVKASDTVVHLRISDHSLVDLFFPTDKWPRLRTLRIDRFVHLLEPDAAYEAYHAMTDGLPTLEHLTLECPNRAAAYIVADDLQVQMAQLRHDDLDDGLPDARYALLPSLKTLELTVIDDEWADWWDLSPGHEQDTRSELGTRIRDEVRLRLTDPYDFGWGSPPQPSLSLFDLSDEDKHLGRETRYEWDRIVQSLTTDSNLSKRGIKLIAQ